MTAKDEGARVGMDVEDNPQGFPEVTTVINWFDRPDAVLQDFVSIANLGAGVAVTLYLPWGVVSGHVHAPHEFFAAAAEGNRASARETGDEDAIALADAITRRAFDPWAEPTPEDARQSGNYQRGYDVTTYLHLTNVKAWLSGSAGPIEHEHLRIRMSAISAWTYGMVR